MPVYLVRVNSVQHGRVRPQPMLWAVTTNDTPEGALLWTLEDQGLYPRDVIVDVLSERADHWSSYDGGILH